MDMNDSNPSTSQKSNSSFSQIIIHPKKRNYTLGELDQVLQKQRKNSKDDSDCNDNFLDPSRNVVVKYEKKDEIKRQILLILGAAVITLILQLGLPYCFPQDSDITKALKFLLDFFAYVAALHAIIEALFGIYSSYKNQKSNAKYDFRFLFCFLNYLFA